MNLRTYVRTYVRTVDDIMAIKPNFLASMGYQYFLSYGAPCARMPLAKLRYKEMLCMPETQSKGNRFALQLWLPDNHKITLSTEFLLFLCFCFV